MHIIIRQKEQRRKNNKHNWMRWNRKRFLLLLKCWTERNGTEQTKIEEPVQQFSLQAIAKDWFWTVLFLFLSLSLSPSLEMVSQNHCNSYAIYIFHDNNFHARWRNANVRQSRFFVRPLMITIYFLELKSSPSCKIPVGIVTQSRKKFITKLNKKRRKICWRQLDSQRSILQKVPSYRDDRIDRMRKRKRKKNKNKFGMPNESF